MKIHSTAKAKVHFMGIGGSGMAGVAKLADQMGFEVTGCDLEASTAYTKENAPGFAGKIFKGHDTSHLKEVDLVVVSPAVIYQNSKHPEFIEAKKEGKVITWQEFAAKFLAKGKKTICVAGTHGKSTTTAMAGKLLIDAGFDPTVVLGAKVTDWGGNSRFGKGEYFVIEADEFYDNFLHYNPEIIILNNIEFDHPDYFKTEGDVFVSFTKFVKNLIGRKIVIANIDSKGVTKLLNKLDLSQIKLIKVSSKFDNPRLSLKVFGEHNVQNALGIAALGKILNINEGKIIDSLQSFSGIERRMQLIGETKSGVKIFDDYAHHPTAIKATLKGLRKEFKSATIWVVVEAHGYNRTHALLNYYRRAFDEADRVIIGPIFKARDKETFGMTPKSIASASGHDDVRPVGSFPQIKNILKREVKKDDIVVVMGAGESYKWAREIYAAIR